MYATFVKGEIVLTDATTAEMVKLMENTFRDVNIALANEFALIAEKICVNVWEAIDIANRHPRVKILRPGPGVGGHCIAIDPWFLVETAREQARLIRQARLVNDGMPEYVVRTVRRMVATVEKPVVACLGLTYKADVDDVRESPAIEVVKRLVEARFVIRAFDPYVKVLPMLENSLVHSLETAVSDADLLLVLVDHKQFKSLVPGTLETRARWVLDTRNCLNVAAWQGRGIKVVRLGTPN